MSKRRKFSAQFKRLQRLYSAAGSSGGHALLDEHDQRAVRQRWTISACCSVVGPSTTSIICQLSAVTITLARHGQSSYFMPQKADRIAHVFSAAPCRADWWKSATSACDHSNAVATRARIEFRSAGQPANP